MEHRNDIGVATLRTPTVIARGRLGLLAILFRFIAKGQKARAVGNGCHRYQFIAASDLAYACLLFIDYDRGDISIIVSDAVKSSR